MDHIQFADEKSAREFIAAIDAAEGFGKPGNVTRTWAEPVTSDIDGKVYVAWSNPPDRRTGAKPQAGGRTAAMSVGKTRVEKVPMTDKPIAAGEPPVIAP